MSPTKRTAPRNPKIVQRLVFFFVAHLDLSVFFVIFKNTFSQKLPVAIFVMRLYLTLLRDNTPFPS
jgi:hypothetical protein